MVGLTALVLAPIEIVLGAAAVGGAAEVLLTSGQTSQRRLSARMLDIPRRINVLALMAPAQLVLRLEDGERMFLPVILAGIAYVVLDVSTVALQLRLTPHGLGPSGVLSVFRPLASVYMVHIAMAAVALRVYPVLGAWAVGIALLLTLILQNGLNLYFRIRRAYTETISVLAQAAELDRPEDAGHARRVADLAVAVARRIGMSSRDLEHVDYAALLHDVGRIGYDGDPSDVAHAVRGAEIVAAVPFLASIAPIIARHHDPDSADAEPLPVGAAIVGVCSEYDRLVREHGARRALEILRERERGVRLLVVDELSEVLIDYATWTRTLP
jgi:putative nucleotidyltransferase with HDIG domain